jgi:hypothetical protein
MGKLRVGGSHAAAHLALDQQLDISGAFGVPIAAEPHHVPQMVQPLMLAAAVVRPIEEWAMRGCS